MENLNIFIAFAAGIVSFLSPCIFPLIPSYLAFIGGSSFSAMETEQKSRRSLMINSLFFIAGFTLIFTLLGIFFSGVGIALSGASRYINLIAGIVVIVLGLNIILDFWKLLNFEKRFHLAKKPGGVMGSVLLGMAFGAGWSPCIGPILAGILFLAGGSDTVWKGALLLLVFSLGLGMPFLAAGIFISRLQGFMNRIKRHLTKIKNASGVFLILIGILIITGKLSKLNIFLYQSANALNNFGQNYPGAIALISGALFLLLATPAALRFFHRARLWQSGGAEESENRFPAVSLFVMILLILTALLSFAKVIDWRSFLITWLTYQGL